MKTRLFNLFTFIILSFTIMLNAEIKEPDFAFPKQVAKDSEKALKNALKNGDDQAVLRSVMDLTLANNSISRKSCPEMLKLIENLRNDPKSSIQLKAVLALIQADIYKEIYNDNRWTYNQRKLPLSPLPEDYTEWSGDQFRNVIYECVKASVSEADTLANTPLSDFSAIVTEYDDYIFTSLFDFIGYYAISILDNVNDKDVILPLRWLCNADYFFTMDCEKQPENYQFVLDIYTYYLKTKKPGSAGYMFADVARVKWISRHSKHEDHKKLCDLLLEMYKKNADSEFSAIPLICINIDSNQLDLKQRQKVYEAVNEYISCHKLLRYMLQFDQMLKCLKSTYATVSAPEIIVPGVEFNVGVNYKNINELTVGVYSVSESKRNNRYEIDKTISEVVVKDSTELLFEAEKQLKMSVPDYGLYVVAVSYKGQPLQDYFSKYNLIRATRIYPMVVKTGDDVSIFVADVLTGRPIDGVRVCDEDGKYISTTDSCGLVKTQISHLDLTVDYSFTKGADKYAEEASVYSGYYTGGLYYQASIATDLPLYHQGDTMQWSAVITQTKENKIEVSKGLEAVVKIYDANYQEIDSNKYTTDKFGRINGSFKLPETGLMGNFTIKVWIENYSFVGSGHLMVSDYKLPTFAVKITDIQRNVPSEGCVTIKGVANDYSGFPITDAKVAVTATSSESFWWFMTSEEDFYSTELTTDAAGQFTLVMDKDIIDMADYPKGLIKVNCNVTSQAGETRSGAATFTLGKPYGITVKSAGNVNVEKPVNLGISVQDPMGNEKQTPLVITLKKEDKVFFEKTIGKPSELINMKEVETGEYTLTVAPADTTLADTYESNDIIFYNASKQDFPIDKLLWTPEGYLKFDSNKGDFILATNSDSLVVNMVAISKSKMIDQTWTKLKKGINHLTLSVPDSVTSAVVYVMGVNELQDFSVNVTITTPPARERFKLGIESFRDNVVPGSVETIKLKTTYPAGTGIESAVMLNMFSQSINDVLAHSPLTLPYRPVDNRYSVNNPSIRLTTMTAYNREYYGPFSFDYPELNLWDRWWLGERIVFGYGLRMHKSLHVQNSMIAPSAASDDLDGGMVYESAAESNSLDEVVTVGETGELSENTVTTKTDKTKNEEYRPSEEPLALFEPMLTADADGNLEFTFTYPQASTTWILNATAFTKDVMSDTQTRNVIASRPLMVKSALPRFLRQGDKVNLTATVMNNTEKACENVTVTVEIINTATGEKIAEKADTVSLDAMTSTVVNLPLEVINVGAPLLYRIKASDGVNSDGEQSLIETLEAAQPVIETRPFYMGIDQTTISVPIPRGENANVTLEFYENPTWSVVTALPGLREETPLTSPSAAGAIFSAAVAEGIMKQNPEIASAIRYWLNSDKSDSTLVSMLSKNQDLKVALLECTPWMTDAMNDTQRMMRLALLLDQKEINRCYEKSIDVLARLQRDGGGWAWCSYGNESSEWATQNVLSAFAMLHQLGYYPSNKKLDDMVVNAVKYLDARIAYHNKVAGKTLTDMLYTYTRLFYPEIKQSSASKKTSDKTIQTIVSDWKKYPLYEKAFSVIILNRGGYPSLAKTVLSSVKEYSSESEEKGMWWDNLESRCWWSSSVVSTTALILNAYNEIAPSSKDIDKIRQWLLLEKCRNDWGDAVATSHAVVAILGTGSKWLSPATEKCAVRVNNELVTPTKIEKITGHFRTNISDLVNGPSTLTIDKVSNIPAYGGLYAITTRRMADVKSSKCDELSIEKRFLVKRLTNEGEQWEETNEFKVGDVVKISLTLKANESMSYVAIVDNRPACLEPVSQLPTPVYSEGLYFYRETQNDKTSLFIDFLKKGTFILEQEFTVTHNGEFASGLATAQSQYAPQFSAHSAGAVVTVK